MKITKRAQITEVIAHRKVIHTVVLEGIKYQRLNTVDVRMPNMDCIVETYEPIIRWSVYTGDNILQDLPKKSITSITLEELFQSLDINDRNGNGD